MLGGGGRGGKDTAKEPEVKFLVPDLGYSRLMHRVVIPARQAPLAGGPVRQQYVIVDNIVLSATKN